MNYLAGEPVVCRGGALLKIASRHQIREKGPMRTLVPGIPAEGAGQTNSCSTLKHNFSVPRVCNNRVAGFEVSVEDFEAERIEDFVLNRAF